MRDLLKASFFALLAVSLWMGFTPVYPGVVDVPTLDAVKASNMFSFQHIRVAGCHAVGDGCGGDFLLIQGSPTVDGCVVIQDGATPTPHLYQRIMQGGPVHLNWCGITTGSIYDATTSGCLNSRPSCAADAIVNAAIVASLAYGNGKVDTDRVSIVINGNLVIPARQGLTCSAQPSGFAQQGAASTAYYKQPGFIALDNGHFIEVKQGAEFWNCGILPTWMNQQYSTINQLIENASWNYLGTAVKVDDESASAHGLFIVGFDTCIEMTGSPRSHVYEDEADCNNTAWVHNQKGGYQLNNIVSKEFFFQQYKAGGARISSFSTDVLNAAVAGDGSGQTVLTYDTSAGDPFRNNYSVLISGLGDTATVSGNGDTTINSSTVANVSPDSVFDFPLAGAKISDTGGCIAGGVYVQSPDSDDSTVTMVKAGAPYLATCSVANDSLTFSINNVSPQPFNGRWRISCATTPCGGAFTLVGSNWTGPSFAGGAITGVTWQQNLNFMVVLNPTEIGLGAYACISGTPPFCTPGDGWTVSSAALSGSINSSQIGTFTLTTGTTAGWPQPTAGNVALIKIDSEALCYDKVLSSTTFDVTARGCNGTTAAAHAFSHPAVTVAAPQVITVSAENSLVFLDATASLQRNSGQAMSFLNNHAIVGGGTIPIGGVGLSASYKTWTSNASLGGSPDAKLSTTANGSGSAVLTSVVDAWKVQPGMTVTGLTAGADIAAGTTVASVNTSTGGNTPLLGAVTLSQNSGTFTGDAIQFSGCGSPPGQPQFGNCADCTYFFGDVNGGTSDTQGGLIYAMNDHGHRRQFCSSGWQDGHVSKIALGNGGDNGAQLDLTSAGVDLHRSARVNMVDVSMQGTTVNMTVSNPTSKTDGVDVFGGIFATANGGITFQTGTGSNTNASLIGAHGGTSGILYLSDKQLHAVLDADNLPGVQLVYGFSNQGDANLKTSGCGNAFLGSTHQCVGSVSP